MFSWWHRHHPPSNFPPAPAFIKRLTLRVSYNPRSKIAMSTVLLEWTDPTVRTDTPPTALPPAEIMEIDVFDFPDTPGVPTINTQIGTVPGPGTSFMTGVLDVGVHRFTVQVRDTTGHVSAPSNVATVTVPATQAPPAAVTDLRATLQP